LRHKGERGERKGQDAFVMLGGGGHGRIETARKSWRKDGTKRRGGGPGPRRTEAGVEGAVRGAVGAVGGLVPPAGGRDVDVQVPGPRRRPPLEEEKVASAYLGVCFFFYFFLCVLFLWATLREYCIDAGR